MYTDTRGDIRQSMGVTARTDLIIRTSDGHQVGNTSWGNCDTAAFKHRDSTQDKEHKFNKLFLPKHGSITKQKSIIIPLLVTDVGWWSQTQKSKPKKLATFDCI